MSTGGESCLAGLPASVLGFVRDSDRSVDQGNPGIIGWLVADGWCGRWIGFRFQVPFVAEDNGVVCRIISSYRFIFLAVMHVVFDWISAMDAFGLESVRVALNLHWTD